MLPLLSCDILAKAIWHQEGDNSQPRQLTWIELIPSSSRNFLSSLTARARMAARS